MSNQAGSSGRTLGNPSNRCTSRILKMRLSEVVALLWAVLIGFVSSNMNGPYKIANSHSFSTDYEKNSLEYFDVYSDIISTEYAEVHWRMHDAISLEDNLIERFRGKVMAIVGYEVDQIREGSGERVPISMFFQTKQWSTMIFKPFPNFLISSFE